MAAQGVAEGDAQCHKLCASLDLKTASFADLEYYHNGLEGLIGIPPKPDDIATICYTRCDNAISFYSLLA